MQTATAWVVATFLVVGLMSTSSVESARVAKQFTADGWLSASPVDDQAAPPQPAAAPPAEDWFASGPVDDQGAAAPESSTMAPTAEMAPTPVEISPSPPLLKSAFAAAPNVKALPDFLPIKLPPFPWWALPIPSKSLQPSNPEAGFPHFPILDNLFLLLKIAESCFNCTYFLSVDTPLLLSPNGRLLDLSPENLQLLYYQVVPFRLPFAALSPLPLAFRIPSFLNGSYLLVTRSTSAFPHDNFVSLNYQRLLAPDLYISDSMVVHGISGFLAPFTLAIPFPSTA